MVETLEEGDIQFFFQPSVQPSEAPEYVLGVQSFFAILSPPSGVHRRLRVSKQRMPAMTTDKFWARIERVGSRQHVLDSAQARPIARGTYAFERQDAHTHLVYTVEPVGFGDAPEELQLVESGDHVVLFEKNPPARATWTHDGTIASLDEEGAELVLVGSGTDDRRAGAA